MLTRMVTIAVAELLTKQMPKTLSRSWRHTFPFLYFLHAIIFFISQTIKFVKQRPPA